jgi:hypothetical protein
MSNHLAIAAVTSTLRNLLEAGITGKDADVLDADLSDTKVTTQPPDKARAADAANNQINLFLYHVVASAAWRNTDMPRRAPAGERGIPPLGLNLYYLLSVYGHGQTNTEIFAHRLLGRAMNILHDHPLLAAPDIQAALTNNDLAGQLERVRITLQPLSLEELSKLWTGFQTQFRLSAAYEVAVVLIETSRTAPTPLPVLTRAVAAQPDTMPPFPVIEAVSPPNQQPSARLGDTVTIPGRRLDGDAVSVRFRHVRQSVPLVVAPTARGDRSVTVSIPNDPVNWPSGFYAVSLAITRAGREVVTNEMAMSLAPRILNLTPNPAARDAKGVVTLTVTCSPQVLPEQPAALLVGDRIVAAQPHAGQVGTLTFSLTDATTGTFYIRLRFDGAESLLVDRSTEPPVFDPSQQVQIT